MIYLILGSIIFIIALVALMFIMMWRHTQNNKSSARIIEHFEPKEQYPHDALDELIKYHQLNGTVRYDL